MITGASQADGALLIIDALEGVRDQTRRHGYLLHLLGVKQVAVVVNKMDRVDFSSARFAEISDEISAHLTGLGVTPLAIVPISARDGDGVAKRTPRVAWYNGPTVVEALDAVGAAGAAASGAGDLQVRRPPHCRGPDRIRPPCGRRRDRHHAGR
jgi:bifunctional enzyme CysN/CysC